jgi:hypothetical protein
VKLARMRGADLVTESPASSERTAVVTILFPAHLFPYAVKM